MAAEQVRKNRKHANVHTKSAIWNYIVKLEACSWMFECKLEPISDDVSASVLVRVCAHADWPNPTRWPLNSKLSPPAEGEVRGLRSNYVETHSTRTSTPAPSLHGLIPHRGTIKSLLFPSCSVSSRTPPGKTSECCGSHWDLGLGIF